MLGWDLHAIGYYAEMVSCSIKVATERHSVQIARRVMLYGIDFTTDCGQGYVKVWFTKNGDIVGPSEKMKRPLHGSIPSLACTVSRRRSGTEDTLTEAQTHHRMIWKQT